MNALMDLGQGPGFSTGQQHADALMCHLCQCQAQDHSMRKLQLPGHVLSQS